MTDGAAGERPHDVTAPWRSWCLLAAALVVLACLVPPLSGTARRFEYGEALQFSLLAVVAPVLVAIGAPWRRLGLARARRRRSAAPGRPGRRPAASAPGAPLVPRLHRRRPRRGRRLARPGAVDDVSEHGWLIPLEGVTLLVFGLGLWLELVPSPPLVPRSGYLRRAVLAALAMWTFWILAYVLGLSNHAFYPNFRTRRVASALLPTSRSPPPSSGSWRRPPSCRSSSGTP